MSATVTHSNGAKAAATNAVRIDNTKYRIFFLLFIEVFGLLGNPNAVFVPEKSENTGFLERNFFH